MKKRTIIGIIGVIGIGAGIAYLAHKGKKEMEAYNELNAEDLDTLAEELELDEPAVCPNDNTTCPFGISAVKRCEKYKKWTGWKSRLNRVFHKGKEFQCASDCCSCHELDDEATERNAFWRRQPKVAEPFKDLADMTSNENFESNNCFEPDDSDSDDAELDFEDADSDGLDPEDANFSDDSYETKIEDEAIYGGADASPEEDFEDDTDITTETEDEDVDTDEAEEVNSADLLNALIPSAEFEREELYRSSEEDDINIE